MERRAHYEDLSSELLRAVRGRRSQIALSRRLGYRSNIVHRWEAQQCWPTAAGFLALCARLKVDVARSFTRFYGRSPAWLETHAATSPAAVAAFLRDVRGRTPIKDLARATGCNRYSLSRWLKGSSEPRLPEFLCLLDVASRRLLDYLATLTEPARLPLLRDAWTQLTQAREAAYGAPWSHAVLRALELESYAQEGHRDADFLPRKLGLDRAAVAASVAVLRRSGQIRKQRGRYRPHRVFDVGTDTDRARAGGVKAFWTREALARLERSAPGLYGYLVFAVSSADLQRLRELQLEYVSAMRSIIADSKGSDCVALYCAQLLDLASDDENALAPEQADLG